MDESQPPPPPPPPGPMPPGDAPPPPSAAAVPTPPPASTTSKDNPIAIAGLTVSILGLVLAIIVIGFFFGLIGVSLSAIALRRSRQGLGRRGMAITGIVLGLLAMLIAIGGFFILVSLARGGEETVRNGIATTSQNDTHPPQDDIDATVCGESNSGRIPTASVRLTNRSEGASVYRIEVEWMTADGDRIVEVNTTAYVGEGESFTVDFIDASGRGLVDSCRVTQIDRSALPVF